MARLWILLLVHVLLIAGRAAQNAQQPGTVAAMDPPRVWLHLSMVAQTFGTSSQLRHYMNHYFDYLGFSPDRFLCAINFWLRPGLDEEDERQAEASAELAAVTAMVYRRTRATCTLWGEQFSPLTDLKIRWALLAARGVALEDWVVAADLDEYQQYPYLPVARFLADVEAAGHNYVQGQLVDRLAMDGVLRAIEPSASLWDQFPLMCLVASSVPRRRLHKVAAAKAYWRSDPGNHAIYATSRMGMPPFFGGPTGAKLLTPYAWHHACYHSSAAQLPVPLAGAVLPGGGADAGMPLDRREQLEATAALAVQQALCDPGALCAQPLGPCGCCKYEPRRSNASVVVHHFKWHAGVLPSMKLLMRQYTRADGMDTGMGRPVVRYYQQLERVAAAARHQRSRHTSRIDVARLNCTIDKLNRRR